jgi:hypothetical protein
MCSKRVNSTCSIRRVTLFIYLSVLTFPLLDCSEFGNFVITLIDKPEERTGL